MLPSFCHVFSCADSTDAFCRCTLGLNVGLMVLFLSLAITFFLLAAGVSHPRANKVYLIDSD